MAIPCKYIKLVLLVYIRFLRKTMILKKLVLLLHNIHL